MELTLARRPALTLAAVATLCSWGATGLAVALFGLGVPFVAAALAGAVLAGAAVGLAARRVMAGSAEPAAGRVE